MRTVTLCIALAACGGPGASGDTTTTPQPGAGPNGAAQQHKDVPREEFNRVVVELALPLFWENDDDKDGSIDPAEIAVLWGVDDSKRSDWIAQGGFTPRFEKAYRDIVARHRAGPAFKGDAREVERRTLVKKELDQG
ncbi:MAG TPA: hypothetical protein VFB62_28600, partial [Polyangiaceae bacterium]|nr:hypothetical protein [Polyangiaceae bacterium]